MLLVATFILLVRLPSIKTRNARTAGNLRSMEQAQQDTGRLSAADSNVTLDPRRQEPPREQQTSMLANKLALHAAESSLPANISSYFTLPGRRLRHAREKANP